MANEDLATCEKQHAKTHKFKSAITEMNDADKQRLTTHLAYIVIILLAVLSSSLTMIFDIEHFDYVRYITNTCFNIVFSIIALILSLKDGRLSNETRRKGELYEIRNQFKEISKLIVDDDALRQWNDELYEKEKLEAIKVDLSSIQIEDMRYLTISDKDFKTLKKEPIVRDDLVLDMLSEYQYEVVKDYRKGNFNFKKLSYTFFKSSRMENEYKKYADSQGKDKKIEFWAYFYRIAMIIIVSGVFALAVVNPTQAGKQQVLYDTISRITNVCTSLFFGYSLAHDEARRTIMRYDFIIGKIRQFLDELSTGLFVPKSRNELITQKLNEIRESRRTTNDAEEIEITQSDLEKLQEIKNNERQEQQETKQG